MAKKPASLRDRHMDHATWSMALHEGIPVLTLDFAKDPIGSKEVTAHEHFMGAVIFFDQKYQFLKNEKNNNYTHSSLATNQHGRSPEMKITITGRDRIQRLKNSLSKFNSKGWNDDYIELMRHLPAPPPYTLTEEDSDRLLSFSARYPQKASPSTQRYSLSNDELLNAESEYSDGKHIPVEKPPAKPTVKAPPATGGEPQQLGLDDPSFDLPPGFSHTSRAGRKSGGRRR